MMTTTPTHIVTQPLQTWSDAEHIVLRNKTGIEMVLWPNGALCAIRSGDLLINQIMGVPPEGAPFGLWLRRHHDGALAGRALVGPATAEYFEQINDRCAVWQGTWGDMRWSVALTLDAAHAAWSWQVRVVNEHGKRAVVDTVFAQDLGLAHANAVRLNEAYTSHYIDHTVVEHPDWGAVVMSRQNQAQAGGRFPWIAHACTSGAQSYATDGLDVFGLAQRLTGVPTVLTHKNLPGLRRQGESACAALQSRPATLQPGETATFIFRARYLEDHPDVSQATDLRHFDGLQTVSDEIADATQSVPASIWDAPLRLAGEELDESEWQKLFPERLHEERVDGVLWSFFTPDGRHVVSRVKEEASERPHGHVLCASGRFLPDETAMGTTTYASGPINAQTYIGNPNFNRFLTVTRDGLQRLVGAGQRVWVLLDEEWRLLGTPSAFVMDLAEVVWLYRLDGHLFEIRVATAGEPSAIRVSMRVLEGRPVRWRATHQLALDPNEMDAGGRIELDPQEGRAICTPAAMSLSAQRVPGLQYALTVADPDTLAALAGDDLIWADGKARGAPYVVAESVETKNFGLILSAKLAKTGDWKARVHSVPPVLPSSTWRLSAEQEDVGMLADVLRWFRHDAWIHLAAPHGLEQYGGAAWGVRDVCQGPVEWLLTEQRYDEVRSILRTVFSHQYEDNGLWPQWFMLGSYGDIQQQHCHGDIMFWPLKALCDYAEAADDPGILDQHAPFTDAETGRYTSEPRPLSDHVQSVLDAYRRLCIPGTALVAYGDGDWDDTLQPVQPEMREGMVSAWTVALAYQVFGQLVELYRRAGRDRESAEIAALRDQVAADFNRHLLPDGVVAGFAVFRDGAPHPLLHPRDEISGIRYRLLPMTRGMISGLFTPEQAAQHNALIREHLRFPDGVRLMDRPVPYRGGPSRLFQRAETAAYFGREVSLQYVHAHLRYAEAMARLGDGDEAWWAIQAVNPLGLTERLPNAAPRQANVYFSSSDGDVRDRYEAYDQMDAMRAGTIKVKGGWRLYSSGPGLFLHRVRYALCGVREWYDRVVFDPVLPSHVRACVLDMEHEGKPVQVQYRAGAPSLRINGEEVPSVTAPNNPYRSGGWVIDRADYRRRLKAKDNVVEIATTR